MSFLRPSTVAFAPVLLALAPLASSAPQGHAPHHPPGALVYGALPDLMGLREAYPRTALGQLLQDENLQEMLGALVGEDSLDPVAYMLAAYEDEVARGKMPPLLDYLEDLRAVSFSLTLPDETVMGFVQAQYERGDGAPPPEGWAIQLHFQFVDGAAATSALDLLLQLGKDEGQDLTVLEQGRMRVVYLPGDGGREPGPVLLVRGPYMTAIAGEITPAEVQARLAGEAPGLDPEQFGAGKRAFATEGPVIVEWLGRMGEIEGDAPLAAAVDLSRTALEALFGADLSMILRGGHWRISIDEAGVFVTEGFYPVSDSPSSQVLSYHPLDPDALGLLPPDAMVTWCTSLHKQSLSTLIREIVEEGEEPLGFDLEMDLIKPLGTSIAIGLPEPKSLMSAPPLIGVITLSDAGSFERGMDGLVAWALSLDEPWLRIDKDEYRGKPLYTLQVDVPAVDGFPLDLGGFVRPCLAILEDRVILSTLPNHTKRELRRALKDDGGGENTLDLASLPPGVVEVGQADWARFLGKIYGAVKTIVSLGAMSGDLPFDVSVLPSAEDLVGFFGPSLCWKQVQDGHAHVYQRSSFGPEVSALPALAPLFLLAGSTIDAAPPGPPVQAQRDQGRSGDGDPPAPE